MDSKELRGLMESYSEVYAPEQIDEVLDTPEKAKEYAGKNVKSMVGAFAKGVVNKDIGQLKTIEKRKKGAELAKRKAERKSTEQQNEEVEQIDEISAGLAGKVVNARIERTGVAADRENKARTPQNVRDTVAAADKEARAKKLAAGVRRRRMANEEVEQLDELSVNKMLAYGKAAEKNRADLNKKWDKGTATHREKMRVLGREEGEERASEKIKKKTGKRPYEMNKLDKLKAAVTKEEVDIFDTVLEFLQTEGYAETLEEAEWIMANELDSEDIGEILEAEGSYGQTPKARTAMGKLAISRMRKPASEYSQRGEKTKKLKAAEKHTRRQDRLASGNNRHGSRGPMDQARRNWSRGADEYGHTGYDGEGHGGSVTKNPKKLRKQKAMGEFSKEDYEIFDTVLEFLCAEGYVETLEEAEWLMVNELDVEDIEAILEAEGSYGKTPKASAAYSALVRKRTNKPASEYSKKGEKTKKVKSAEKHMWRSLRGGPHHGRGKMTADDRTERRSERAFDLETSYGSGSVTKNPKKLRKQKAMGEIGESYDAYNVVLSYLLDEGFASTEYSADKIILNMSEAWFEDIMELNRYEKETGKDSRTGKPTSSGGKYGGSDTQSKVMRSVMKSMGSGRMGVQPRGQKKEPGKKPPKAGEYGGPASPEQKVAKRRADKKRGEEMMHSARD